VNRRRTIEVLGVVLTADAKLSEPGCVYYSSGLDGTTGRDGKAWITATHVVSPMGSRWLLRASSVYRCRDVRAEAVTLAAATSKLGDAVLSDSYVYSAVKTARRAA
jgi:hypothetical protein